MRRDPALPDAWTRTVRTAMMHAVALAHWGVVRSRSWAADSPLQRVRLASKLEAATTEIARLREEVRIKDARWAALPPHRRPHYSPADRMAILVLRAARGWSAAQTGRAFLVEPETISAWMRRVEENGERPLVRLTQPVNKFPEFVSDLVRRLKATCPAMGKKRVAQFLARAGLHMGATTVRRMLKRRPPAPNTRTDKGSVSAAVTPANQRTVTARYPDHVWHVDLTAVPTVPGFWVPWVPFALPQVWPFCWWVVAAVDQFSRRVVALRVFSRPPTARMICRFLGDSISRSQATPRYIVTDKGRQFWSAAYKSWCRTKGIRPRFGAIGRCGSIAIVERFIRSLKNEATRRIRIPLRRAEMRRQLALYLHWYNRIRPHQALEGSSPEQQYLDSFGCEVHSRPQPLLYAPGAERHNVNLRPLRLHVSYVGGRKHLPIVTLRSAA